MAECLESFAHDPVLGPLVRRIVLLWPTGALPEVDWVGVVKRKHALGASSKSLFHS